MTRLGGRECLIVVNHYQDVRLNTPAHCPQRGDVLGERGIAESHFDSLEPSGHQCLGLIRKALRNHKPEPATVVCRNRARPCPEHHRERLSERNGQCVPERNIDRRQSHTNRPRHPQEGEPTRQHPLYTKRSGRLAHHEFWPARQRSA